VTAGGDVVSETISNEDSSSRESNSNTADQGILKPLLHFNIIPSSVLCHRFIHKLYLISFQWNCFARNFYQCSSSYIVLYFFLF
jgi:hypothetical protein